MSIPIKTQSSRAVDTAGDYPEAIAKLPELPSAATKAFPELKTWLKDAQKGLDQWYYDFRLVLNRKEQGAGKSILGLTATAGVNDSAGAGFRTVKVPNV